MSRISVVGVAAVVGLCAGVAPGSPARAADPVVQGSIATSGRGLLTQCSLTCEDFIAAGCPQALVVPNGVDRSIADLSGLGLGGQSVTFSWDAATNAAIHELGEATNSPGAGSKLYFYVLTSCAAPTADSMFALMSSGTGQTKTVTLPSDAHWLIVETDDAQGVTWAGV